MSIFEFDQEKYDAALREEGRLEECRASVLELLQDIGEVPDEVREAILVQTDMSVLKIWRKRAARADSIDEWREETEA